MVPGTKGLPFLMLYFTKQSSDPNELHQRGLDFVDNRNLTAKTTTTPDYTSIELNHAGKFFTK